MVASRRSDAKTLKKGEKESSDRKESEGIYKKCLKHPTLLHVWDMTGTPEGLFPIRLRGIYMQVRSPRTRITR